MEQRDIFPAGQSGLNAAAVERRLAGYAAAGRRSAESADGRPRGDHDLNPEFYEPDQALTRAAVLVPIVVREAGLTLLLTQRTDHLYDHAGQVSFPGGRIDAGDSGPEAAALRETEEEIGLSRERVRLIGRLDTYLIRTGFEVTPVVGLVTQPFDLAPDSFEVAEVFEVPLDFFLDPNNCERHTRLFEGKDRHFYAFPYGDHYIWGATAGMLINLAEVLGPGA